MVYRAGSEKKLGLLADRKRNCIFISLFRQAF